VTSEGSSNAEVRDEWPHFRTDLEGLSQVFRRFGEVECKQIRSPLYERFSFGVADDPDLLRLAAARIQGQPPPNVLYAAVQYLLLRGVEHRLKDYYPALTHSALTPSRDAYVAFRDFCREHEAELRELIATRTVQTNVVRRSIILLPAFALVTEMGGGRPLTQIEVGASAGLNLNWQHYHYDYDSGPSWGNETSPVRLTTERRGDVALPNLPETLRPSSSVGIEVQPVSLTDDSAADWLRSLIWPENEELSRQLTAAIAVAKTHPPNVVEGDANTRLPALLERGPADSTLCVFATHVLYQFQRDALITLFKTMQAYSKSRPVYFISMEGTGNAHSELKLTVYDSGDRTVIDLANCHPHGYWLEWLDGRVRPATGVT
jgi:hypothetical protein